MSELPIVSDEASIVLRGRFNPSIFSPGWLLAKGLVGPSESDEAKIEAIVPQASIFEVGWLRFEATDDRLRFATRDTLEVERVRDVAAGVLKILDNTPVRVAGLNRTMRLQASNDDQWHRVGDRLVPKEFWEEVMPLSGMQSLTIQGVRRDEFAGYVRLTIQPIETLERGVFFDHNDHYVLKRVDRQFQTRDDFSAPEFSGYLDIEASGEHVPIALDILNEKWEQSQQAAFEIISRVWSEMGAA